jgi:hypothetical protein
MLVLSIYCFLLEEGARRLEVDYPSRNHEDKCYLLRKPGQKDRGAYNSDDKKDCDVLVGPGSQH